MRAEGAEFAEKRGIRAPRAKAPHPYGMEQGFELKLGRGVLQRRTPLHHLHPTQQKEDRGMNPII